MKHKKTWHFIVNDVSNAFYDGRGLPVAIS